MTVKKISPDTLPEAAELGDKFWAEGSLPGSLKKDLFVKNWTGLMDLGMGNVLGLYKDDKLVGALGFISVNDINDGELVASETFWFVEPESRGQGVKLLIKFIDEAKQMGCKRMSMVHLMNSHADKLSDIYKRMGFTPLETHYIKELTPIE